MQKSMPLGKDSVNPSIVAPYGQRLLIGEQPMSWLPV